MPSIAFAIGPGVNPCSWASLKFSVPPNSAGHLDTAVAKVLTMGVALAAVADDGSYQEDVNRGVLFVINLCP